MRQIELEQKNIDSFVEFCIRKLSIKKKPKIVQLYTPLSHTEHPTFGSFDPENIVVTVYVRNRHIADILRSIGHELVHAAQNERGLLKSNSGETGSEQENQANAMAGVLMRKFADENPKIIF